MRSARVWWRKHYLGAELGIAVALTVGLAIWTQLQGSDALLVKVLSGDRASLYGALASVFGSLLGFTITAASIIIATSGEARLTALRGSERYPDLWKTFFSTIRYLGAATMTAFAGLVYDKGAHPAKPIVYLACFAVLISAFRLGRCVWVLERIIAILTQPPKTRTGDQPPPIT